MPVTYRVGLAKGYFHTISPCFFKGWHLFFSPFNYFQWKIPKQLVIGPFKVFS